MQGADDPPEELTEPLDDDAPLADALELDELLDEELNEPLGGGGPAEPEPLGGCVPDPLTVPLSDESWLCDGADPLADTLAELPRERLGDPLADALGDGDPLTASELLPDDATLADAEGLPDADGDPLSDSERLSDPEAEALADGDPLSDSERLSDPEAEALADGDPLDASEKLADGEALADSEGLPDAEGEPLGDTERLSELAMLSETLDQDFADPQLILPSDQTDKPN